MSEGLSCTGGDKAAAHRAFGDALLPLAHPDAFLQGGAFLQQKVPTAVRVSGPDAGSAGRRQGDSETTGTSAL